MPVLSKSLREPIQDQFTVLLPDYLEIPSTHPLGCHRGRIIDRVVFDHIFDDCITKASSGGEMAVRRPVDQGNGGRNGYW